MTKKQKLREQSFYIYIYIEREREREREREIVDSIMTINGNDIMNSFNSS